MSSSPLLEFLREEVGTETPISDHLNMLWNPISQFLLTEPLEKVEVFTNLVVQEHHAGTLGETLQSFCPSSHLTAFLLRILTNVEEKYRFNPESFPEFALFFLAIFAHIPAEHKGIAGTPPMLLPSMISSGFALLSPFVRDCCGLPRTAESIGQDASLETFSEELPSPSECQEFIDLCDKALSLLSEDPAGGATLLMPLAHLLAGLELVLPFYDIPYRNLIESVTGLGTRCDELVDSIGLVQHRQPLMALSKRLMSHHADPPTPLSGLRQDSDNGTRTELTKFELPEMSPFDVELTWHPRIPLEPLTDVEVEAVIERAPDAALLSAN